MTVKVYEYDVRIAAIHKLRVNLKSLVAESRAIRFEEQRAGFVYRDELREHRTKSLREELRYTGLALSFIRKRKYSQVEKDGSRGIDVIRLRKKIDGKGHFGNVESLMSEIGAWIRGQ